MQRDIAMGGMRGLEGRANGRFRDGLREQGGCRTQRFSGDAIARGGYSGEACPPPACAMVRTGAR